MEPEARFPTNLHRLIHENAVLKAGPDATLARAGERGRALAGRGAVVVAYRVRPGRGSRAPIPVSIPRGPAARAAAAPVLLGTYSIPIEVADRTSAVTTYQPAHPAAMPPIPANSYTLLRVSGRVRLVSGPWWPGPPRPFATYTAVQTTQATGRARTRVWIRTGASVEPPTGGYEPLFAPAPDGEDRIVLVRTGDVPAELWTGRDLGGHIITATQGWCIATPWCSPSPGEIATGGSWADRKDIEAYHVAESNTVSATLIPEPLQIAVPESFAPGQPATMSVQPWGGMRLRHPQIVSAYTADVEWRWFPGDTLAVRNPAIIAQRLPCNAKECTFTPAAAGRMSVATWVEGAYVETSEIVGVQAQPTRELKLECTDVTTRGDEISCSLGTDPPGGEIEVEAWWFEGDIRGKPFRFPSDEDLAETGQTWRGRLVISGNIHVRASIDGQPAVEKSVPVRVEARGWDNVEISYQLRRVTMTDFNAAVSQEDLLPPDPRQEHDMGRYAASAMITISGPAFDYVTDYGPNHGLAFFKRVLAELEFLVVVHPEMETRGDFYRRQAASPPAFGTPCLQSNFPRFVELILAHEGYPMNERSHTGVYLREYRARAGRAVEDLVAPNGALEDVADVAVSRLTAVAVQADGISDAEVDGSHRVPFGCNFNFRR